MSAEHGVPHPAPRVGPKTQAGAFSAARARAYPDSAQSGSPSGLSSSGCGHVFFERHRAPVVSDCCPPALLLQRFSNDGCSVGGEDDVRSSLAGTTLFSGWESAGRGAKRALSPPTAPCFSPSRGCSVDGDSHDLYRDAFASVGKRRCPSPAVCPSRLRPEATPSTPPRGVGAQLHAGTPFSCGALAFDAARAKAAGVVELPCVHPPHSKRGDRANVAALSSSSIPDDSAWLLDDRSHASLASFGTPFRGGWSTAAEADAPSRSCAMQRYASEGSAAVRWLEDSAGARRGALSRPPRGRCWEFNAADLEHPWPLEPSDPVWDTISAALHESSQSLLDKDGTGDALIEISEDDVLEGEVLGNDFVLSRCAAELDPFLSKQPVIAAALASAAAQPFRDASGDAAPALKHFQVDGVNRLALHMRFGAPTTILADDKGLGKKAQVAAFLGAMYQHASRQTAAPGAAAAAASRPVWKFPTLIVVPNRAVAAWERELRAWGGTTLRMQTYFGDKVRQLRGLFLRLAPSSAAAGEVTSTSARRNGSDGARGPVFGKFNVVLTTYDFFALDGPEQRLDRRVLASEQWGHVVLDSALALQAHWPCACRVRSLAARARRRVLVTGAPLRDNLAELTTLIELALPAVFNPVTRANAGAQCSVAAPSSAADAVRLVTDLRRLLAPLVVRRAKHEVLHEFQQKQHVRLALPTGPRGRALYDAAVDAAAAHPPPPAAAPAQFARLQLLAQHPLHARARYGVKAIAAMAAAAPAFPPPPAASDIELHRHCATTPGLERFAPPISLDDLLEAPKCARLAVLLPELVASRRHPVVFSQWRAQLDVLELLLQRLGLRCARIDEHTTEAARAEIAREWNAHAAVYGGLELGVLLMSKAALAEGFELAAAGAVVLHDVSLDPAADLLAENCARSLAPGAVTVYRLVAADTIDRDVDDLSQAARLSLLKRQRRPTPPGAPPAGEASHAERLDGVRRAVGRALAARRPPARRCEDAELEAVQLAFSRAQTSSPVPTADAAA